MRHFLALLALAWALPAMAVSIPNEVDWAQGTNWQYVQNFHGLAEAWVYVPDSFSAVDGRRGVVFHLIGCGQRPFQAAQAAGWPAAAEAHGLVVVVPAPMSPARPNRDAPNVECFNYGYDGAFGVYRPTRNDPSQGAIIGAARALIDDADLAIDPNQIYVAGLSAGGATAVEVACMAPDLFAGVGTASAPGIGSAQGTAVMPPPATFSKNSVKALCQQWADGSGVADARALLASQVYAIVSDNNALPAGNGPFDTTKFNDQQIWDGDKFCPHIYQGIRAQAFSELLELGEPERGVEVGRGSGIGCPGGENSVDDGGEVRCVINDQIRRDWVATADVYRDAQGRTRLIKIEQDTLRHAWPSGPIDAPDTGATPTRETLRAEGYIIEATGEFDRARTRNAANGIYGTIYFNHDAIDFPMLLADLWANNNPRIGAAPDPEPDAPEPDVMPEPEPEPEGMATVTVDQASGAGDCVTVAGRSTDAAMVEILAPGLAREQVAAGDWTWSRCGLTPGRYLVFARGLDAEGIPGPASPARWAEISAGGAAPERAEGDLTEHSNAGRVTRFTELYFALRDAHCVFENFVWQCTPFTLYRCADAAEWTDVEPDCGGGGPAPVVALSLEAGVAEARVPAGAAAQIAVTVRNAGPDVAEAVYVAVTSAAEIEGADCVTLGEKAWCDVGQLAANAEQLISLEARAGVGMQAAQVEFAGAQQPDLQGESVAWEVEAGVVDPEPSPGEPEPGEPEPGEPEPGEPEPGEPEPSRRPDAGEPDVGPGSRAPREDPNAPIKLPKDGCAVRPGADGVPAWAWVLLALAGLRRRR